MIDADVFADWMGELDEHFPGSRSERILRVYYRALRDRLSTDEFEAACVRILGEREYFPPWREFLRDVKAAGGPSDEDLDAAAREQWEVVRNAMRNSRGGYPEEMDEVAREVVSSHFGGLAGLGRTELSGIRWIAREFREEYVSRARRRSIEEGPDALPAAVRGALRAGRAIRSQDERG